MWCPYCGAHNRDWRDGCAKCGKSLHGEVEEGTSKEHSRKPRKRLGTLIVLLVTVMVVNAGVAWYVLSLGYVSVSYGAPITSLRTEDVPNGFKCTFGHWFFRDGESVSWSDLRIHLTDGVSWATWKIDAQDLNAGTAVTHDYGARQFRSSSVSLNVSDRTGNGYADYPDSFVITAGYVYFFSGDVFLVFVYWEPGGTNVCWDYVM